MCHKSKLFGVRFIQIPPDITFTIAAAREWGVHALYHSENDMQAYYVTSIIVVGG